MSCSKLITTWRSSVLSLPLQLGFPGLSNVLGDRKTGKGEEPEKADEGERKESLKLIFSQPKFIWNLTSTSSKVVKQSNPGNPY
jgi:hypothetical protein